MRRTDKKIDNQLRLALTDVCETALKEINGFLWLTHLVNYSNFPKSLKIVCIFDTDENLADFLSQTNRKGFESLTQMTLTEIDINLKKITNHISYDTEENCKRKHNGNWAARLG
tara:strand:- start:91476 stop:91817 length:342 start_codon:yes stop_codon:yes gene_type:complete